MVCQKSEFLMRGANHPRLSKSDLLSFKIAVPSKEKQTEIVEALEDIRNGELEKSVENMKRLFDEYRSSVLAHAFQE